MKLHERGTVVASLQFACPTFNFDNRDADILQFRAKRTVRRWSTFSHTLLRYLARPAGRSIINGPSTRRLRWQ